MGTRLEAAEKCSDASRVGFFSSLVSRRDRERGGKYGLY